MDEIELESQITQRASKLFNTVQKPIYSLSDPNYYIERVMGWSMTNEKLKIALFRFVDVLPYLDSSKAIISHVQEYFSPLEKELPSAASTLLKIATTSFTSQVASRAIQVQVRAIAKKFIVGESPDKALTNLTKIRKDGAAFTVDLLGEAALSEIESRDYFHRYLDLLTTLQKHKPNLEQHKSVVPNHRAEHSPVNISVKLSALYSQTKAIAFESSVTILCDRLVEILHAAKKQNAFVYIDMEDSSLTSITLEVFKRVASSAEFRTYPHLGIVLQAYMRRTEDDLDKLIDWTKARGTPIAARLVKGAYWDTETILSRQRGWPNPVWEEKSNSDFNFEKLSRKLLDNHKLIMPAFGSHNIRSIAHALTYAEKKGVTNDQFEIQTLFGMGEPIRRALAAERFLVREYTPIGELIPGMGYLVRRLLENTSNDGFLRLAMDKSIDPSGLLTAPKFSQSDTGERHLKKQAEATTFSNCALVDFSIEEEREKLFSALSDFGNRKDRAPDSVYPCIEGNQLSCEETATITSPEDPSLVLANCHYSSQELAEKAVRLLQQFQPTWATTDVALRADVLRKTASKLTDRRTELTANIVLEAGKQWAEADADLTEAIDFLNYYAEEAEKLFSNKPLLSFPGEENSLKYIPRGVTTVIAPWNFPLAIPCGMFAAALVTGNCAILKPAEQTSLIAKNLFQCFLEAGLPGEAAAFLPGRGEEIGPLLISHPDIATIVFTGSMEVGLSITESAARTGQSSVQVKKTITEMGGKNAIIVDSDADLDEAVRGVIYSAFGFQGQKCSACSRVIVLESCYERFVERLVEATKSIKLGAASDPATFVGPVIDKNAHQKLLSKIQLAKEQCRTLLFEEDKIDQGNFQLIPPAIFDRIPDKHFILQEELFGPVLAVIKAKTFEDAVELALDSKFALTGGVFSRSPGNIAYAINSFNVGNLYLNRGCTGALVARQPFGGFRLSGVGSKAGGADYLRQFVLPRAITENTMRRGFAPL